MSHRYLAYPHVMFLRMEIEIAIFSINGEDLHPLNHDYFVAYLRAEQNKLTRPKTEATVQL